MSNGSLFGFKQIQSIHVDCFLPSTDNRGIDHYNQGLIRCTI